MTRYLIGDKFIDETTGFLWQVKHIQAIRDEDGFDPEECYGLERISGRSRSELWIIPVQGLHCDVKTTLIPRQTN